MFILSCVLVGRKGCVFKPSIVMKTERNMELTEFGNTEFMKCQDRLECLIYVFLRGSGDFMTK